MQTEVMEMKFNEKLQKLRKEKGMSQEALADELGVSRQAVSKWENGQVYPETEKLIQLGRLFHVSIDYLLNEENEQGVQDTADQDEGTLSVSMDTIQEYLKWKRPFAFAIAIGVAIILCGVTIPILFDEEVRAAFFLLMVGIAVAVFVAFGIRDAHRWQYLDERKIYVSRSDVETLNKAYQKFQKRFMVVITSGIFLIIFGLCATVAADALIHDAAERYGAILFYFTAAAMLLIIPAGIMNGAYRRFIYFEAANQEKDKEKQASRYAFIWGITMPLAAMVFLFIGLTQENWEIVWIIFPIVAILTAGLINILEYRNSRREEK